jgi:hypothetical protein
MDRRVSREPGTGGEPGTRNPEPGTDTVHDLREQLRALGYLDSSVGRFVLRPAETRRRPIVIAMLASLRIGILAALFLGPSAAIGVSGRLPALATGPRDVVVIAIYMGVLFGVAAWLLAFLASLLVSASAGDAAARRARPLSLAAGGFVTSASLAYLTLWWRSTNAGWGWSAPGWTAVALGVAVAISLLLGHAVRVTALAVILSRRSDHSDAVTKDQARSWRVSLAVGVLAFVGAAALLMIADRRELSGDRTPSTLTVVSPGLRLRVIAIDGFDPGIFDALASAGQLPALAAALSTRATLAPEPIRDPARVWTTIATGQPPERHGVHGLETRRVVGVQGTVPVAEVSRFGNSLAGVTDLLRLTSPAIASGTERREKTFWEVASDAGLRTAVVNWWATWPAPDHDPDGPAILTDRATLRLERGGAMDAEIAPAALYERLRQRWPTLRTEASARVDQWLGSFDGAQGRPATLDADARSILRRSAELDAMELALAREVSGRTPDLLAVYLPGLDIAQHALLASGGGSQSASQVASRLDALRSYYVCLDRLLAEVLRPDDNSLVIVATEPGRVETAAHGLVGLSGALSRRNHVLSGTASQLMPTVLYVLGVPVSRTLPGAPLTELMTEDFVRQYPVRLTGSYGTPSARSHTRPGKPLDQEALDRLRSLGYVR